MSFFIIYDTYLSRICIYSSFVYRDSSVYLFISLFIHLMCIYIEPVFFTSSIMFIICLCILILILLFILYGYMCMFFILYHVFLYTYCMCIYVLYVCSIYCILTTSPLQSSLRYFQSLVTILCLLSSSLLYSVCSSATLCIGGHFVLFVALMVSGFMKKKKKGHICPVLWVHRFCLCLCVSSWETFTQHHNTKK